MTLMVGLEELTHDNQRVFRVERTKEIVHPEKVGEPQEVKIRENYGKGLIFFEIWKLREKTHPNANGYTLGDFKNVPKEKDEDDSAQIQAAQVQFYKYENTKININK